jgi:hypothetical protein
MLFHGVHGLNSRFCWTITKHANQHLCTLDFIESIGRLYVSRISPSVDA